MGLMTFSPNFIQQRSLESIIPNIIHFHIANAHVCLCDVLAISICNFILATFYFSRPNIPGYEGCTLWQGVYAPAHTIKEKPAQSATTATVHR